jgi:hypothetical protein
MAAQPTHAAGGTQPSTRPTQAAIEGGPGTAERLRSRKVRRAQARLTSARNRRRLAQWLRRTANRAQTPHPLIARRDALLHYRVATVRTQLLDIAAIVERTNNPDPARIATLQNLLANGCDSPLYNPIIHTSELLATLHYIRSGL